jgi:hypothetical protein
MTKIYLCLILLISIAGRSLAQTLFSDEFSGTVLNPAWIIINPNPAGLVVLTDSGELLVHASAQNGGSDIYNVTNFNAPQIYQPVDTGNHSWLIETKLRFDCTNDYQGAGFDLHVSPDARDSTAAIRIIEKQFSPDWMGASVLAVNTNDSVYTDSIIYLRCSRSTDSLRVWYSADSISWNYLGGMPDTPIYYAGLFAVRQPWDAATNVDSYAYFDYFHASGTTAIADVSAINIINVYPNPTNGKFTLSGLTTGRQVDIYNALGQAVLGLKTSSLQQEVDLSAVADGIYILRISAADGVAERELIKIKN